MNGTEFLYSPGEQAVISLTGLVFCPIVCVLVYIISITRLRVKENETVASKAHLFYRMTSGIIIGQVLNFTVWSVQLVPLFVCVGYYILEIYEAFQPNEPIDEDVALNKNTMEDNTVSFFDDVTSAEYRQGQVTIKLLNIAKRRRLFMLFVVMFAFTLICISNGFHLASGQFAYNKAATIACYVVNTLSLTVVLCSCMIHARFHVREEYRKRVLWWTVISLLWSVVIVFCGSAIIVLVGIQASLATDIIQSNAFTGIFAASSGLLLRAHEYFHHNTKSKGLDKQDVALGLIVFAVALAQSTIVGIYY